MIYIHLLSSHEISFSEIYGSGRKDGRSEGRTDMEITIFCHLRRGIINLV